MSSSVSSMASSRSVATAATFRPGWLANFGLHTISDDWLKHEKRGSPDTRARLLQRYLGQKLCAQCRSPNKDELGLGIQRFSKESNAEMTRVHDRNP
eukprot:7014684-Prymnesium_polylepis.1